MKWLRTLFWIEAVVQLTLGLIMLLYPSLMQNLIYVPQPDVLIQAIGSVGLSMALLAILAAQNSDKQVGFVAAATLALFNFGLSIFLGLAASHNLISWLGIIIHAPFAIVFAYATVRLKGERK